MMRKGRAEWSDELYTVLSDVGNKELSNGFGGGRELPVILIKLQKKFYI